MSAWIYIPAPVADCLVKRLRVSVVHVGILGNAPTSVKPLPRALDAVTASGVGLGLVAVSPNFRLKGGVILGFPFPAFMPAEGCGPTNHPPAEKVYGESHTAVTKHIRVAVTTGDNHVADRGNRSIQTRLGRVNLHSFNRAEIYGALFEGLDRCTTTLSSVQAVDKQVKEDG